PAGRTARYAPRRSRVHRRAVEVILAQQAERQLVGDRFASAGRPCRQQLCDADGVRRSRRVGASPVWISAARDRAGDIDEVFDGEAEGIERTATRGGQRQRLHPSSRLGNGVFPRQRSTPPIRTYLKSSGAAGLARNRDTLPVSQPRRLFV